ncbi:MAG: hypothetical protein AB7S81_00240 [Bdellovibrionales bacterium]
MKEETIVVRLPLRPNRRSGRKYLIAPDGATVPMVEKTPQQNTMQRALVRAFMWRREIEEGKYNGIRDFARNKGVHEDYVSRQIGLTLLAPSIIEDILENRQPGYLTLQRLYRLFPLMWDEQEKRLVSQSG